MTKDRNPRKEGRKKAAMSLKEKRAAKKARKEGKVPFAALEKK